MINYILVFLAQVFGYLQVILVNFWNWFVNNLPIAFLSGLIGFIFVFIVEWIRKPKVKLEVSRPLPVERSELLRDGITIVSPKRKYVKLKVTVEKGWRSHLPIPKNLHAFSKIIVHSAWQDKPEYQAKWDSAPEPVDYETLRPRLETAPFAKQPENLMYGDISEAGIAVKHDGDEGFYFFDADYYINARTNYCTKKRLMLKITFKSSLVEKTESFVIKNPNINLDRFVLSKV